MRIAIIGSRTFEDYTVFKNILNEMRGDAEFAFDSIVSGGANGADKLAELYATEYNIPILVLPAQWDKYGKRAGYVRNQEIWDNADFGIAFWDGKSKGTAHSFAIAKKQQKRLVVCNYLTEDAYEI